MGYKAYSDSYLMSLTKAQIIELLRIAEHNFFATEEALNNSAKAGMEIAEKYDKAKELLKEALIIAKIRPFCDERYCDICKNVGCEWGEDCFEWEHEDEALALIGEDSDAK